MTSIKKNRIPDTDLSISELGFGCSNLLGDKTSDQALRLLNSALDAGVTHFDVARYYGFGQAEKIVGAFIAGRRDQVTVTTKFGLEPPGGIARSRGLMSALRTARHLARMNPVTRKLSQRSAKAIVKRGRFDVDQARAALESSLTTLGTDYIDLWLLHECTLTDCTQELYEFLETTKKDGKIRHYGIGTAPEHTEAICIHAPEFTKLTQFRSSLLAPTVQRIASTDPLIGNPSGARFRITHGALSSIPAVLERFTQAKLKYAFEEQFGFSPGNTQRLAAVLLRYAADTSEGGAVLFQSSKPETVADNIRLFTNSKISKVQKDTLQMLSVT